MAGPAANSTVWVKQEGKPMSRQYRSVAVAFAIAAIAAGTSCTEPATEPAPGEYADKAAPVDTPKGGEAATDALPPGEPPE